MFELGFVKFIVKKKLALQMKREKLIIYLFIYFCSSFIKRLRHI